LACGDLGGAKCSGTQTYSAAGVMALSESFFEPLVAAVDCRETDGGNVREEIMVGNAYGGKPGSHGSEAILLSHT